MAVDLRAHLLNTDYNLNKNEIFRDLLFDRTFSTPDVIYPGLQSGLLTLTNANYILNIDMENTSKYIRLGSGNLITFVLFSDTT